MAAMCRRRGATAVYSPPIVNQTRQNAPTQAGIESTQLHGRYHLRGITEARIQAPQPGAPLAGIDVLVRPSAWPADDPRFTEVGGSSSSSGH